MDTYTIKRREKFMCTLLFLHLKYVEVMWRERRKQMKTIIVQIPLYYTFWVHPLIHNTKRTLAKPLLYHIHIFAEEKYQFWSWHAKLVRQIIVTYAYTKKKEKLFVHTWSGVKYRLKSQFFNVDMIAKWQIVNKI